MAQQNTRKPSAAGNRPTSPAPLKIAKANGDVKEAYALLSFDNSQNHYLNGLVNFGMRDGAKFNLVKYFGDSSHDVTAGAYANGYYYVERTQTDLTTQAMIPVELLRYDIDTGEQTTVGPLTGYTSHINDMAYDYSTNTMYAISLKDGVYSVLYTINLNTAESTVVANLDRRFFTLACSYDGQLYAISFEGDFCKVNKQTGEVELVGATGFLPTYFQSMEFDHSDETLYWAADLIDGSGQDDCIATVDTTTGKAQQVAIVGDSPQLAGLYIPFSASAKGTPAAVSDFTVKADANGDLKVALSWKTPSTTFDGQALSAISAVKVYREKTLVKTFDNPAVGGEMSYTDVIDGDAKDGAFHTYTVVACNDKGDGAEMKQRVFVGHDKLLPVTSVVLTTSTDKPTQAVISWKKPEGGINGGYIDWASLKYDVVRYPDDKKVATDITATEFTDNTINTLATYYYSVVAHNADCTSEAVNTESRVLGPSQSLPVDFDFTKGSSASSWTIEDANGDGYTWTWTQTTTETVMGHQASSVNASDDWLISYYLPFEKDVTYRADLTLHAYSADKLVFALLKNTSSSNVVQELHTLNITGSRDKQTFGFVFKPTEDGPLNFAIHALSPMRADWLELYDLSIRKAESENLAALSVSGDESPMMGKESTYTVKVENRGTNTINNFRVLLNDQDGNVLAQKDAAIELQSGESADVDIAWTPQNTDVTAVQGEVSAANDGNDSDNKTTFMNVSIRASFDGTLVSLGTESNYTSSYSPFEFSSQYAAALNIYSAEELDADKNMDIVKTAWPYDAALMYSDIENAPVRVYMANTDLTNTTGGWIPENEMTLVYDGTVSVAKKSTGEMPITLSTPFPYEAGKNLAVLTVLCCDTYHPYIAFKQYTSPLEGNAAFEWGSYYKKTWFDFTQKGHQDYYSQVSSILIYMKEAATDGIASATLDSVEGASYVVYDISGRKVAEGVASANGVPTTELTRGINVVKYAKDGKTFTTKIAVNK